MICVTRLIDANALREDWLQNGENEYVYDANAFIESIDDAPTVDAIVVRCNECKYSNQYTENLVYCEEYQIVKVIDGFCNLGKRKDCD